MWKALSAKLCSLSLQIGAFLLLINVVVVMYGVVTRYVIGGAPIWTDELSRYSIIATAMLAAAGVWHCGGHMRVALAERFLPKKMAQMAICYQWLLSLCIAACGVYLTARYALSVSMFTSQGLGISRTVPLLSMPIGFALLALTLLLRGPRPIPQQLGD